MSRQSTSMTSAPGEPGDRGGTAAPRQRFGLLLLVLIATYLLAAFTTGKLITAFQIVVFVGALFLALRNARMAKWIARLAAGVVLAGSSVAFGLALAEPNAAAVGAVQIWAGLVLLTAAAVILYRILASTTVTLQSIYGALSAYIIIGLMFAAFYGAMNKLGSGPFFANGQPGDTRTFQYFSFTTLTTLGYGDFTAAGNAGRAIAVMEAMFGQIFLATLVARLVASFRAPEGRQ
jgi:Ion channel